MDILGLLALGKAGSGGGGSGAVDSVNGQTGDVVLDAADVSAMPSSAESALLALLEDLVYADDRGEELLNNFKAALDIDNLTGISATFTQGTAEITEGDSLDTLRQYLVVTANYPDGVTIPVTNYILSGTLEVGTSTITATFGGKTDTFSVTVTSGANGLVDGTYIPKSNSESATGTGELAVSNNKLTWGSASPQAYGRVYIPLLKPLKLKSGDTVTYNSSTENVGASTIKMSVNLYASNNKNSANAGTQKALSAYRYATSSDTQTVESDVTVNYLLCSSDPGYASLSCTLSISVNNEVIF